MRKIYLLVAFLSSVCAFAQTSNQRLLEKLDSISEQRATIVREKVYRIDRLKIELARVRGEAQYAFIDSLYEEYKSFNYDSAFSYAVKLQIIAKQLHDSELTAKTRLKMGFALVSSGLLNEALDTLRLIKLPGLRKSIKADYYYLMVRTCYDLADFSQHQYHSHQYAKMAAVYADSAIALLPPQAAEYLIVKGLTLLHLARFAEAKTCYEDLMKNYSLTDHQFAIVASTLSYLYSTVGDVDRSKEMLIRAAISDTKSSTKEAIALVKLADLLYHEGNVENAYRYIKLAMEDANFYGARYRQMQVASIFPIIESERFSRLEERRKMLMIYALIITISVVALGIFFYVIMRQYSKLQVAKQALSKANYQLLESNKIKEEYLWYYFNTTADYITKLDSLKATIELKVISKKVEKLRFTAENINIKRERNELFHNFDKVFLKLFPDFVTVFNELLTDEHKMVMKDGQLLNIEMRIFALIRLGITDHEKIAKILGYSLTTIYTYKTRIKAKAKVSSEEFDNKILGISTL